jgi:hypothetical protein
VAYYKKALYYNWHYADAMYNLGVAYGEMLKFEMVSLNAPSLPGKKVKTHPPAHHLSDIFVHFIIKH